MTLIRVDPACYDKCPYKGREEEKTHRIEGQVEMGQIWDDARTSPGAPRAAGSHQKLGQRHCTDSL